MNFAAAAMLWADGSPWINVEQEVKGGEAETTGGEIQPGATNLSGGQLSEEVRSISLSLSPRRSFDFAALPLPPAAPKRSEKDQCC